MWRTGIAIDFVVGTIDDTMMHHDHEDAMSDESNDSTYDTEIMHHHIPSRNLSDQLCHSGIIMPLSTFALLMTLLTLFSLLLRTHALLV